MRSICHQVRHMRDGRSAHVVSCVVLGLECWLVSVVSPDGRTLASSQCASLPGAYSWLKRQGVEIPAGNSLIALEV